jgi:hypothetical protein
MMISRDNPQNLEFANWLRKTTRLDKPTGDKYTGSFDEKSELDIPCYPVNGPVKLKKGETAPVKHPTTQIAEIVEKVLGRTVGSVKVSIWHGPQPSQLLNFARLENHYFPR